MSKKLNIVIWNEFRHEKLDPVVTALYPNGIHAFIKDFLKEDNFYYLFLFFCILFVFFTINLLNLEKKCIFDVSS